MNIQIITFSADEQKLVKTGGINCYASNIVSYIEAHFALGQNWSGYDSVRAVWSNDNNMTAISTVLDSNGHCLVPFEVLKTMGVVKVNLVGSISVSDVLTDRLTTFPCEALTVARKAKINGSETTPITPSQFEQYVEMVHDEVEVVTGMTAEAETLPAGSEATARYENGVLYLGIPQGIQGERGETGADGNGIAQVLYNSDYSITFVFTNGERFTTPSLRGETGPQGQPGQNGRDGADGRDGTDGTDGVTPSLSVGTVTTLPSTEDAYVTRRGTDENPVFDFGIPQGPKGDKGDTGEVSLADLSTLLPTDTASGSIASFPDGQSVIPALSVLCDIEPIQSGSGTPSPDNVRPISGRTEVVTSVVGKNLLDKSNGIFLPDNAIFGGTAQTIDGSLVLPAGNYTFSVSETQNGLYVDTPSGSIVTKYTAKSISFTLSQTEQVRLRTYKSISDASIIESYNYQLELGSTASSYEPYESDTHTTSLGRTVYGGEVEVVGGSLTDKMGMVDMTSITDWNIDKNAKRIYKVLSYIKPNTSGATVPNMLCNRFETITPNGIYANNQGVTVSTGSALQFHIDGLTDNADVTLAEINQYFVDNPTQVVFELAQPQTYQLTPTEIALLKGQNNIWTDSGEVEVTYKADVGLYIDKRLNG